MLILDLQAAQILKALKHYIKTEQKDRMHSVNHFKHLRDTDPAEAERVRQQSLDHLQIIHQRIQQSIQMLDRVPEFSKKIQLQIGKILILKLRKIISVTCIKRTEQSVHSCRAGTLKDHVGFSHTTK